jgi:hypothetical protein
MANIIYIGPYRQYDYVGIASELHIRSIIKSIDLKKHKLFLRPLYLSNDAIKKPNSIDWLIYETLPDILENETYVIQHAPVEYLSSQSLWRSIAIPVLNPQLHKASKYNDISRLNRFDQIIISNDYEKNLLLKSEISAPSAISQYDPTPYLDTDIANKKYDFGLLEQQMYYYGFIGPYKDNISIIQQIIVAFSLASRALPNCKLVFFLRGTQQDKNEIEKFYDSTSSIIKNQNHNIQFIFGYLDTVSSFTAINSIDCLLSLNLDVQQSVFENYASYNSKTVISRHNINVETSPAYNSVYDIEDMVNSIPLRVLVDKIKNTTDAIQTKNKISKQTSKTIGEIICQIVK